MNLLDILQNAGGWYEGHTSFKNGFHGNGWIEKGFVVKKPKLLELFILEQAKQISNRYPSAELLVGPAVNGAIIASHLLRILNLEFAITYGKGQEIEFHRINIPKKELKVVLIEDLVFTGKDIRDNIEFLKKYGLDVLGVSTWVNRADDLEKDFEVAKLIEVPPFEKYNQTNCPMCKSNQPVKFSNIRE